VSSEVLWPRNTWSDGAAYDARARKLAADFAEAFERSYGNKDLGAEIVAACPGK